MLDRDETETEHESYRQAHVKETVPGAHRNRRIRQNPLLHGDCKVQESNKGGKKSVGRRQTCDPPKM